MGGRLCKHVCKKPSESDDALETQQKQLEKQGADKQGANGKTREIKTSPLQRFLQVGINRSAEYQALQETVAKLDSAPTSDKAALWKACDQAWKQALEPKQIEDDKKISDLISKARPGWFSFEYFPPKTDAGIESLTKRIKRMKSLGPVFVDFTWGAGGSTSVLTLRLTSEAKNVAGFVANMHLTCTNQQASMAEEALVSCKAVGIRNIVALRGDPPRGQEHWTAREGGFSCALDLVKYMREKHGDYFCISVAGYPEGHPDAIALAPGGLLSLTLSEQRRARVIKDASGKEVVSVCRDAIFEKEMEYLKQKVDAGANFIITQMFLDVQVFFDFVAACKRWGISVPIVPGIMMLSSFAGLKRMTDLCKTRLPDGLLEKAEKANSSDDAFKAFGIEFNTALCRALLDGGAQGLHFYTLNLEKVVVGTLQELGLISSAQAKACLADDSDARHMVSAQGITTGSKA